MQRIAFVLAITVCAVKGSSCTLSTTLRAAAANSGRFIGAAVANYHLTGDASYKNTAKTQFNLITAENECKFDATEPTRNSFSFTGCDAILSFATANSMTFRGHCLVWGEQTSSFVSSLSSSDKKSAMVSHIKGVLSHYKGKAYGWDVVNEAIADGSSSLKSTVWYPSVSDYIDVAFTTARAADSSTKLFYNDYNCDGVNTKSTYMYTMAKSMLSRGIPIDGVGLQMHISTDYYPTQADMTANFKRFSDIGLEVHLTELDVGCSSSSQWDLQAKVFGYVLNACLAVSGCKNYEVWGVQDSYSWRTGKMPLLFDSSYNAKPAACTVRDIFAAASGSSTACSLTSTLPTGASAMGTCSTSVTGGSSCSYTCSSGYTAVAGKCSSSGTWTTSPSCTSTNTGSCKLSTLPTGASSYGTCSSSVSSGSSCSLGCYSGYTATAGSCSSGSWTTSPSCTANPCKLTSLPSGASGMGTCTSSTASGSTCALSCPSTSTKVTGVCSAGSWNPAPNCTSTCTVSKTCGSQSCGSIWNGCATVSCGSCSSGYTCDGSSCKSSGSSSDWTQIYPDSFFSLNWNVDSDSKLVQTNFSSYWLPRVVAYTGAQTSWFSSFTTVTVFVKATEGSVNVGLRLGQGSDRPYDRFGWKLTIKSGVASSYFCRTLNGPSDQCKSTNTGLSFSSGSFHNLTMQYKFGSSVITYAWLDGVKLYSKGLSMSLTQYSNTGKLFIATYDSTSQKVFKELIVRSKTAVHVTLQECMSTSTWNSLVANLLGVSTSSVSSRVVGSDAYCSDSKKRSGMLPMEVETVIADDEVSMTPSSSLAQILQEAISGGAMVENQVVVTAAATAVPIIAAGEAGAVAFGAASGLSTAAVAGIAAGCAVGGVLIAGAATTGAIVLVKKHMASSEEPAESQDKKKRATFFDKVFNRGVDVMGNNAGAQHSSITNRAPPVEVAL